LLGHGYLVHDFDVNDWAAPEFLDAASRELVEESFAAKSSGAAARWQSGLDGAQAKAGTPRPASGAPVRPPDDAPGTQPPRLPTK
jgi:hypothetical protein